MTSHDCNITEDLYARSAACMKALKGVATDYVEEYIQNILKSRDETWIKLCELHEQHTKLKIQHDSLMKNHESLKELSKNTVDEINGCIENCDEGKHYKALVEYLGNENDSGS